MKLILNIIEIIKGVTSKQIFNPSGTKTKKGNAIHSVKLILNIIEIIKGVTAKQIF